MPLPRAPPAAVRQTMQHAFEDLEKVITPQDSKDYHDCSLERVRLEALQIENQLGSRGWLRNMRRLRPLFTGLEHYSKVVDTLCNGTPFLPWVWAPITLILRIASEHIESFDSLIGAYGRIGSSLQRFEILHKSFIGDPRFHESTAAFYADILELHKHAYKFVRRSGWKLLFSTSWGRFQRRFGNILEDLKRHEDLIDRLVNAIDISEARQLRQELSSWREESLQKISLEDKEQSAKEFQAIQSWLRVNECDQLAIFETAAGPGNRFPGTCGWVLNNAKIRSWLQKSPQSSILWLSGVAGSGKSVISSQLINFIRSRKDVVLYHFCTNVSIASSEYEQVLKSLLEQLLRQDGDLTASVYTSYVLTKKEAAVPTLEKLLLDLLITSAEDPNQHSYIWIVLDGVDELREHSPNSQSRLLNFVKQIVSKTNASENVTCRAFISCRPSKTVNHILRQKPTVSLTDEKKSLGSAIQEYALQRLRALMTRFQQLGLTALEIENIGKQISLKSDGMFLYARLVLDFVSSNIFVRGDELRNSINELPRELSAFYLQLLSQILAPLDQNSKRHIECIFGWVAFARRPLRKSELLSAVGFSSGDPDTEYPAPQYILDVCRTLIEERSDTTLTFIHVSVKEFLQSSASSLKVSEEAAVNQHCIASITCLLSSLKLLDQDRQQAFQILVRGVYGLQLYATEYWTDYLLSIVDRNGGLDKRSTLYNLLCQLCTRVDSAFQDDIQDRHDNNTCDDKRLDKLKEHQDIHRNVRKALWARSPKQLEQRLRIESTSDATKERSDTVMGDGVSGLLPQYQNLLLHVMNEVDIPGVSSRDLEAFRSEFSTSIHTCRLRTCARATVGFETKDLRIEHEKSHVQRYPCTRMGCQYPPFLTPGSLKTHVRKEHDAGAPPMSIRRIRTVAINPDIPKERRLPTLQEHQRELLRLEQQHKAKQLLVKQAPQEEPSSRPGLSDTFDERPNWEDSAMDFSQAPYSISWQPCASPSPTISESGLDHQAIRMDRDNENNLGSGQTLVPPQQPPDKVNDHQMQLMLLEQQSKKRLMMARQEQDGSSSGVSEQPATVEATHRDNVKSTTLHPSTESSNHATQDYHKFTLFSSQDSTGFDASQMSKATPQTNNFGALSLDTSFDNYLASQLSSGSMKLPQQYPFVSKPRQQSSLLSVRNRPYSVSSRLSSSMSASPVSTALGSPQRPDAVGADGGTDAADACRARGEEEVYDGKPASQFDPQDRLLELRPSGSPSHSNSKFDRVSSPDGRRTPPSAPPQRFATPYLTQGGRTVFSGRPRGMQVPANFPRPQLTMARQSEDGLPQKVSGHGNVDSRLNISHTNASAKGNAHYPLLETMQNQQKNHQQSLDALRERQRQIFRDQQRQVIQQAQLTQQAAPAVTPSGPEQAEETFLPRPEQFFPDLYDSQEPYATSHMATGIWQNSVPATTAPATVQQHSRQSPSGNWQMPLDIAAAAIVSPVSMHSPNTHTVAASSSEEQQAQSPHGQSPINHHSSTASSPHQQQLSPQAPYTTTALPYAPPIITDWTFQQQQMQPQPQPQDLSHSIQNSPAMISFNPAPLNAANTVVNTSRRKLPEPMSRATPFKANAPSSYWSVTEMNNFPELLSSFGTDWGTIAKHMTTKTATMVKIFYTKMVAREKPEWAQIAHLADEKMQRGERLPDPPRRPEPRIRNG